MERERLINLVTRAQQGDQDAMSELFNEHYTTIYAFAMDTLKNKQTTEDVTQETFLEIFRTIGNLKEPLAFVTWAKRIAYHQCTRYFKKKKDFVPYEDEDGNTIFDDVCEENSEAIPQEAYEGKELKNTIRGMVDNLSEEQRSAVLLFYYDHLPVAKIAEIQEVSEGTVKSRLNYARKAMEKSILSYEQKSGILLHGVAFAPLFALGLDAAAGISQASFLAIQQAVTAGIAGAAGSAATSATVAAAGTAAAGTAAAGTAAATTAGTVAAKAGTAIAAKIVAGVVATAVLAGGAIAGVHLLKKDEEEAPPAPSEPKISYNSIAAGCEHLVALKEDGTVYATGRNTEGQCDVEDWTDVIAVSARGHNTVALKSDGTVYAAGDNSQNQCDVGTWTDVVSVCTSGQYTVGVKDDGTLLVTDSGYNTPDLSMVEDAVAVEMLNNNIYYINDSSETYHLEPISIIEDGFVQKEELENAKQLSISDYINVCLTENGKVVITGEKAESYDASEWKDIMHIDCSCESYVASNIMVGGIENLGCTFDTDIAFGFEQEPCVNIIGVNDDGKVFYEGNNIFNDMTVVDSWEDITSVAAGDIFCAGIKEDGTVVLAGNNEDNTLDVSGWTDIKVYE